MRRNRHRRPVAYKGLVSIVRKKTRDGKGFGAMRLASLVVFALFSFLMVASLDLSSPIKAVQLSKVIGREQAEPFDIEINAQGMSEEEIANLSVTEEKAEIVPTTKSALQGKVDKKRDVRSRDMSDAQAMTYAKKAKVYMDKGRLRRAIENQRRAVELDPENIEYRLQLAIMHDHANDKTGAAWLYQQVVQAYDGGDDDAPDLSVINDVRQRLAYLSASNGSQ